MVSWGGYGRLKVRVLFFSVVWHCLSVSSVSHMTTDSYMHTDGGEAVRNEQSILGEPKAGRIPLSLCRV